MFTLSIPTCMVFLLQWGPLHPLPKGCTWTWVSAVCFTWWLLACGLATVRLNVQGPSPLQTCASLPVNVLRAPSTTEHSDGHSAFQKWLEWLGVSWKHMSFFQFAAWRSVHWATPARAAHVILKHGILDYLHLVWMAGASPPCCLLPGRWIRTSLVCLTATGGAGISPKGYGPPVTSEDTSSLPSAVPNRERASFPPSEAQNPEGLEPVKKRMRGGQSRSSLCPWPSGRASTCPHRASSSTEARGCISGWALSYLSIFWMEFGGLLSCLLWGDGWSWSGNSAFRVVFPSWYN